MERLGAGLEDDGAEMGEVGAADVEREDALAVRAGASFFLFAAVVVRVAEAVGLVVRDALELRSTLAAASSSFLLRLDFTGERSSLIWSHSSCVSVRC